VQKGIWQNLFDFPSIELSRLVSLKELTKEKEFKKWFEGAKMTFEAESQERKHLLSHQKLHCKFLHFKVEEFPGEMIDRYRLVDRSDLAKYPVPKLVENYLREETNLLSLFGN
jgi:A/G-specific adenine glycosylase